MPGAFSLPCWRCGGAAERCSTCADPATGKPRGRVWFDRCPTALWEPWVGDVVGSLTHYRAGFLPVAGGMQDQARTWVQALRVGLSHLAECERLADEREARSRPRG